MIKLAADATGAAFTLIEATFEPGSGSSPHIHTRESETFCVLEGRISCWIGDERVEVDAGGIVFGPPDVAHWFSAGPDGARLLLVMAPSGIETFFRDIDVPDLTPEAMRAIRRRHGIESVDD